MSSHKTPHQKQHHEFKDEAPLEEVGRSEAKRSSPHPNEETHRAQQHNPQKRTGQFGGTGQPPLTKK